MSALAIRRPIDRGYLVNPDMQRNVWAHSLSHVLRTSAAGASLLLTEPVLNLPNIQEATDQVW